MRLSHRPNILATVAAVCVFSHPLSSAVADDYWQVQSGDWANAANWSGGVPAGGNINADVYNGGTVTITQSGEGCGALLLGGSGGGTVQMTGGSVYSSYGSNGAQYIGNSGTGTFIQSGGTDLASGGLSASINLGCTPGSIGTYDLSGNGQVSISGGRTASLCIGASGTGNFMQSGGMTSINSDFGASLYLGSASGSNGTYNLSGTGQLLTLCQNDNAFEYVGYSGTGSFNQSGGTHSVTSNDAYDGHYGYLYFGYNAGVSGTYSLTGGQLSADYMYLGYSGMGSFTQSGGTTQVNRIYFASNGGSSGTYNLNGGWLNMAGPVSGFGKAALNVGGGTLQVWPGLNAFPVTLTGNGGNATFDTENVSASSTAGLLSGPGGLFKAGPGTLILGAANTYGGTTFVSGGTLALANSAALQQSTLDTSGGGTLSFGSLSAATVGEMTGTGGLVLANTASQPVTLTVGNNGLNATYSGLLSGSGSVIKVGTGRWTLGGNNTYSGTTTVNAGVLVAGIAGALSPSSAMAVSGGTLDASGYANTVKSLTVTSGGALSLGVGSLLTCTGPATLGGTLIVSGQGSGVHELLAYGSETGTFSTVIGLPSDCSLRYVRTELDVVPEPSTLALLGAGAVGLLAYAGLRARRANPARGIRAGRKQTPTPRSAPG